MTFEKEISGCFTDIFNLTTGFVHHRADMIYVFIEFYKGSSSFNVAYRFGAKVVPVSPVPEINELRKLNLHGEAVWELLEEGIELTVRLAQIYESNNKCTPFEFRLAYNETAQEMHADLRYEITSDDMNSETPVFEDWLTELSSS